MKMKNSILLFLTSAVLVLAVCAAAQSTDVPNAPSTRLLEPTVPSFCQVAWQNGIPCSPTNEPAAYKARRAQARARFLLADGTAVPLRLVRKAASNKLKPGDGVEFELMEDVRAGGLLVMPRGTRVVGYADSGTHGANQFCGRGGALSVSVSRAYAITGEEIPLRGGVDAEGFGFEYKNKAECVLLALGRAAAALQGGAVSAENVSLRQNTVINAAVHGDLYFDAELLATVAARVETEREAQRAGEPAVMVLIYRRDFDVAGNRRLYLRRRGGDGHNPRVLITGFTPRYRDSEHRQPDEGWRQMTARDAGLLVDGKQFRLAPDQTQHLTLPPGPHHFRTDQAEMEVELEKGQAYFVRIFIEPGLRSRTYAEFVTQDDAEYEMHALAGKRVRR